MKKGLFQRLNQGHSEVLSTRNQLVVNQAKIAQEALVKEKEALVNGLKLKIDQLTDLAPENTTSLTVKNALSDNPVKWVADLHQLSVDLVLAEQEHKIAKANYEELFPEEEAVNV